MSLPNLLTVRNLHKAYGPKKVLKGVDLDVPVGTVTAMIGPSGSGKTTFLRSLNALEIPESGIVSIDQVSVDYGASPKKPVLRQLRAQSGMVFQSHNLFPHRTALENIIEGPVYAKGIDKATATEQAHEYLRQVGLSEFADRYPGQLSGGQQQRVGIARALALEPKLLLFDEPTSALDPETVGDVLGVMRDLAEQGWTIVVVTHEIAFARDIADQVLFLDEGVVAERGSAADVLDTPSNPRTRQFLGRVLDRI